MHTKSKEFLGSAGKGVKWLASKEAACLLVVFKAVKTQAKKRPKVFLATIGLISVAGIAQAKLRKGSRKDTPKEES